MAHLLSSFQAIGDTEQQEEAKEIQRVLDEHYAQPEAVSFATAESEKPEGKK